MSQVHIPHFSESTGRTGNAEPKLTPSLGSSHLPQSQPKGPFLFPHSACLPCFYDSLHPLEVLEATRHTSLPAPFLLLSVFMPV